MPTSSPKPARRRARPAASQNRQRPKKAAQRKPGPVSGQPATLRLRPGRFYADRTGSVWCCFEVEPDAIVVDGSPTDQAWCVEVKTADVTSFYPDGRWDSQGKSPKTLVEERVAP